MKPYFSSDVVRRWLISLFSAGIINDFTREREVIERDRTLGVLRFIGTLVACFAASGEARLIFSP